MVEYLKKFIADDSGATAIEYALLAGGVAVAIVAAAATIGTALTPLFESTNDGF